MRVHIDVLIPSRRVPIDVSAAAHTELRRTTLHDPAELRKRHIIVPIMETRGIVRPAVPDVIILIVITGLQWAVRVTGRLPDLKREAEISRGIIILLIQGERRIIDVRVQRNRRRVEEQEPTVDIICRREACDLLLPDRDERLRTAHRTRQGVPNRIIIAAGIPDVPIA